MLHAWGFFYVLFQHGAFSFEKMEFEGGISKGGVVRIIAGRPGPQLTRNGRQTFGERRGLLTLGA